MDLTVLQTITQRISHAQASRGKEVRLSIAEAQQLLAAIAYVTATSNQQLRAQFDELLVEIKRVSQISLPEVLSGGGFK
jgi:iron-sulfur cluster repair protein YtfE (RIC family)